MSRSVNDDTFLEKEFDKRASQEQHHSISKKDDIMKAAIHLFLKQGYGSTTVRQIAKAANTSASLIIYHFGTKQAIAHAFLNYKLQMMRNTLLQKIDLYENPELFCCAMVRLFQTAMSSPALCRFYHDMIEEGLFREFFFSSEESINPSVLILSKRKIQLPQNIFHFYSHYIIPSIEMALWLSTNNSAPEDDMLDIPFRTLMGLISVPKAEVNTYCNHSKELIKELLKEHPEFLTDE